MGLVIVKLKQSGTAKVKGTMSNVAAKRLEVLKAMMEAEKASKAPDQNYIDDLKLSIEQCELDAKNASDVGYRMVG